MNLQENIQRIREMMISEEMVQSDAWKAVKDTLDVLKKKKKVLLLSCSNRYNWDDKNIDIPKSKMIAMYLNDELGMIVFPLRQRQTRRIKRTPKCCHLIRTHSSGCLGKSLLLWGY